MRGGNDKITILFLLLSGFGFGSIFFFILLPTVNLESTLVDKFIPFFFLTIAIANVLAVFYMLYYVKKGNGSKKIDVGSVVSWFEQPIRNKWGKVVSQALIIKTNNGTKNIEKWNDKEYYLKAKEVLKSNCKLAKPQMKKDWLRKKYLEAIGWLLLATVVTLILAGFWPI